MLDAETGRVIWARQAPGATIALDGVLDEPAWAAAESKFVRYGKNNGNPGSGFKEEGGKLAKDSTYAEARFLVIGNQLYIGVTARDSSVGGGKDFNRFDGLLMSIKDHTSLGFPKPPAEYLYSWWYADTCDAFPATPGKLPHFLGSFGYPTFPATQCDQRTLAQQHREPVREQITRGAVPGRVERRGEREQFALGQALMILLGHPKEVGHHEHGEGLRVGADELELGERRTHGRCVVEHFLRGHVA